MWLIEILEKYLAPSGRPGVFLNSLKSILELGGLCIAFRNSRKILSIFRKSWTVYVNSKKNILKLWGLFMACRNSRKILFTSRMSWSFLWTSREWKKMQKWNLRLKKKVYLRRQVSNPRPLAYEPDTLPRDHGTFLIIKTAIDISILSIFSKTLP